MVGPPFWFLGLQDTLQQRPSGNFEKIKVDLLIGLGNLIAYLGPHGKVVGAVERGCACARVHQPGVPLLWGRGWGLSVPGGSFFTGQF